MRTYLYVQTRLCVYLEVLPLCSIGEIAQGRTSELLPLAYRRHRFSLPLSFAVNNATQVKLDLLQVPGAAKGAPVDHGLASGRIAFACDLVPPIHSEAAAATSGTVITPPLTLPTPGKADVVVTILGDPGKAVNLWGRLPLRCVVTQVGQSCRPLLKIVCRRR